MPSPESVAKRREYQRLYSRRWYAANKERAQASVKAWKAANPERMRELQLKHSRRSKGVVDATGEKRTGQCPICLKTNRKLRCDHNHETGKIRGWLCATCNSFLGPTGHDRVKRATAYLERTDGPENLPRP